MITVDGTIRLCADLDSDPADVVWLAVAYELKSPSMGAWARKGWTDGLKRLGCVLSAASPAAARALTPRGCASVDSLAGLQGLLAQLRQKLARDPDYFTHVYNYTFEFSRPPGQRSLGARAGVVARGAAAD